MDVNYYRRIINNSINSETGVAMGKAIKDNQINPETYAILCREAKQKGFKFVHIMFVD